MNNQMTLKTAEEPRVEVLAVADVVATEETVEVFVATATMNVIKVKIEVVTLPTVELTVVIVDHVAQRVVRIYLMMTLELT
jgi:hypothetical protein